MVTYTYIHTYILYRQDFLELIGFSKRDLDDSDNAGSKANLLIEKIRRKLEDYAGSSSHTYIHTYIHTYTHIYTYIYTSTYIYKYMNMG